MTRFPPILLLFLLLSLCRGLRSAQQQQQQEGNGLGLPRIMIVHNDSHVTFHDAYPHPLSLPGDEIIVPTTPTATTNDSKVLFFKLVKPRNNRNRNHSHDINDWDQFIRFEPIHGFPPPPPTTTAMSPTEGEEIELISLDPRHPAADATSVSSSSFIHRAWGISLSQNSFTWSVLTVLKAIALGQLASAASVSAHICTKVLMDAGLSLSVFQNFLFYPSLLITIVGARYISFLLSRSRVPDEEESMRRLGTGESSMTEDGGPDYGYSYSYSLISSGSRSIWSDFYYYTTGLCQKRQSQMKQLLVLSVVMGLADVAANTMMVEAFDKTSAVSAVFLFSLGLPLTVLVHPILVYFSSMSMVVRNNKIPFFSATGKTFNPKSVRNDNNATKGTDLKVSRIHTYMNYAGTAISLAGAILIFIATARGIGYASFDPPLIPGLKTREYPSISGNLWAIAAAVSFAISTSVQHSLDMIEEEEQILHIRHGGKRIISMPFLRLLVLSVLGTIFTSILMATTQGRKEIGHLVDFFSSTSEITKNSVPPALASLIMYPVCMQVFYLLVPFYMAYFSSEKGRNEPALKASIKTILNDELAKQQKQRLEAELQAHPEASIIRIAPPSPESREAITRVIIKWIYQFRSALAERSLHLNLVTADLIFLVYNEIARGFVLDAMYAVGLTLITLGILIFSMVLRFHPDETYDAINEDFERDERDAAASSNDNQNEGGINSIEDAPFMMSVVDNDNHNMTPAIPRL